jgi:hypothetical protein
LGNALQVLLARKLEGFLTRGQLLHLAEKLAGTMHRTQQRNRRARRSAIKKRRRELRAAGIRLSALRCCDEVAL